MKTKLKKWHIVLMSFVTLILAVFSSLFSLKADPVDDETGEILLDNWEISLVFYDSTVNNGKTPLTEINWDASDGSYKNGEPRLITIQINYKNDNAVTTYQPGELQITIDSLLKGAHVSSSGYSGQHLHQAITVGANDSTHTGYDWNYTYIRDPDNIYNQNLNSSNEIGTFIFTNANVIEEKANFEGSIQIAYSITPYENNGLNITTAKYKDSHTYNFNKNLTATLNNNISSNEITFDYTRTYIHPWKKADYTIEKTASSLEFLDLLGEGNASDYYWVKYAFRIEDEEGIRSTGYPYITARNIKFHDSFPEECLVYDRNSTRLFTEENFYTIQITDRDKIDSTAITYISYLFVGYPKSIYNEETNNLNIINTVDLYVEFIDDIGNYVLEHTDDVAINLAEFDFEYPGDLYGIYKEEVPNPSKTYYEALTGIDSNLNNIYNYYIDPLAVYTGNTMDVRFGDDLLYITSADGSYRKLEDDEYYFTFINFPFALFNGHGNKIPKDKYEVELWIKTKDNPNYTLHSAFKNPCSDSTDNTIDFTFNKTKHVTGFYFIIKNMEESLINKWRLNAAASYGRSFKPKCSVKIDNADNILETGTIYNFSNMQIYFTDENGNKVLQNEPELNSYNNFITKEEIATYDLATYGAYMQRSTASSKYEKYQPPKISTSFELYKTMSAFTQDSAQECFLGTANLSAIISSAGGMSEYEFTTYGHLVPIEQRLVGFNVYDLLPEGMELNSSVDDIINNLTISLNGKVYDKNSQTIAKNDFIKFIKERAEVSIVENWNNTNRTKITITVNFEDEPLMFKTTNSFTLLSTTYDYSVSYDSYMEFGSTWTNTMNFDLIDRNLSSNSGNSFYASWSTLISDKNDINENGNTSEYIAYKTTSKNIISVVSTHQDVTKYVKTDKSNYSTGTVNASYGSEYQYKLRVRTGIADVTNLILYDNLEIAQPDRQRWQGEFLGIDTTYAENKGYTIKPYYSENPNAGNLYDENGDFNTEWKEYLKSYEKQYANGLKITFNNQCATYNSSDYFYIYYYQNGTYYRSSQYSGTRIAGLTVEIPATDFYIYWYSNASSNNAYGFSIDSIEPIIVENPISASSSSLMSANITELSGNNYPETEHNPYNNTNLAQALMWHYTYTDDLLIRDADPILNTIKSLAFEYLDSDGNAAILPANSLTYVLINMKAPDNEDETRLARNNCRTQWNAIDKFDRPVDFVTGIESNVVKIALPNSVDEDSTPFISLRFIKEIKGSNIAFENMKLNKANEQIFMLKLTNLTANEDGSHDQITGLLNSDYELIITQIYPGTYLLEELNDIYFDFVEFTNNNDPEIIINGVTFEQTDQGYIITIAEDLPKDIVFNIKVKNEIESFRPYEDKQIAQNLFVDSIAGRLEEIKEEMTSRQGMSGRLYIPSVNYDVALFEVSSSDGTANQKVTDASDSAAYMPWGNQILIGDHYYQGFDKMKNSKVGTIAYINNGETIQYYICIEIGKGQNTRSTLLDAQGNDLYDKNAGGICMYTCNQVIENNMDITYSLWQPIN